MTTKTQAKQTSLKRRIRQFYEYLNQSAFRRCYQMTDPRVRYKPSSVTLFQYENALRQFLETVGSVGVRDIRISLHLDEPNELFGGRDFALGKTTWEDDAKKSHLFSERWVREGRTWYTLCTGFIVPATADISERGLQSEDSAVFPARSKQTRRIKPS